MNWTFHNIVQHVRPKVFGFIDHDCFPIARLDIPERMDGKLLYGLRMDARDRWYLWAGLCFYRFSAVDGLELDFKHSIEHGVDTGGANWPILYAAVPQEQVVDAGSKMIDISLGVVETKQQFLDDAMLHVGRASYRHAVGSSGYRKLLSAYIWETYLGGLTGRIVDV